MNAPKGNFVVKELLWSQQIPVDPTEGLTLYATVLEDEAKNRLTVYADVNKDAEAFDAGGRPLRVTKSTRATRALAPFEPQAYVLEIDGPDGEQGPAGGSDADAAFARAGAPMAEASAIVCTKVINGKLVRVTCPPCNC